MKLRKMRFLILRRVCQIGLLLLFVLGNYSLVVIKDTQSLETRHIFGGDVSHLVGDSSSIVAKEPSVFASIVQGNLSHSSWFGGLFTLSDPLNVAQIFLAGGGVALDVILGALLVIAIYSILLGRAFCSFVCPINLISDLANFLRTIFGFNALQKTLAIPRKSKYAILALSLILSMLCGVGAFELISPISMLSRGLVFGLGFGIFAILAVFCFDLFVLKNGFCGHLCPLGAMYSLLGAFALLRIRHKLSNCTQCMKCVKICPEPEVLKPIGKVDGALKNIACIRCGRCIEVCDDDALHFSILDFKQKERK